MSEGSIRGAETEPFSLDNLEDEGEEEDAPAEEDLPEGDAEGEGEEEQDEEEKPPDEKPDAETEKDAESTEKKEDAPEEGQEGKSSPTEESTEGENEARSSKEGEGEKPELETLYTAPSYMEEQLDAEAERALYMEYAKEVLDEMGQDFDQWVEGNMGPNAELWWDRRSSKRDGSGAGTGTSTIPEAEFDDDDIIEYTPAPRIPQEKLMGMKSFQFLETRVLATFIQGSEDERMTKIRERLGYMKKVDAPKKPDSLSVLHSPDQNKFEVTSQEEIGSQVEKVKEYSPGEWALKNAISFLQKAGCKSPEHSAAPFPEKHMNAKMRNFLKKGGQGHRRREAKGHSTHVPEVTPPMKRRGDRAMWRFIIDNSKPKYPLPRFILPRHRFLKKMEAELVGPGSYELDYYEKQRLKKLQRTPSMYRSCAPRIPEEKLPSPAAANVVDPHTSWDAALERMRHPGKVPLFQSTPCNFRYKNYLIGCGLPPGHYNIKSPMDEFVGTVKSLRGMYDEDTGKDAFWPRTFQRTVDTYHQDLGPGSYNIRPNMDEKLADSNFKFKGKISKTPRSRIFGLRANFDKPLFPTANEDPGPGYYNPHEADEWTQPAWAPFGVGVKERKPATVYGENKLMAPDFYHYRDVKDPLPYPEIVGNGYPSNFIPLRVPKNRTALYRERNRALNIKLDQAKLLPERKKKEKGAGPWPCGC